VGFVWIAIVCTLAGALAGALAAWSIGRRRRGRRNPIGDERALMRTLIDLMPDPIFAKDAAGRFTLANQAVARVMGAGSADELIGKTDADFYSPEMAAKFRADEQSLMERGVPLRDREELGADHGAGELRWHLTTKVPVFGRHGEAIGLVGITRDIHRRKQAEEEIRHLNTELDQRVKERTAELAAERNLLRTLIDNMPDSIYAKDLESRYILANNAAAAGVGVTPETLLGRTVLDFYPSDQAQSFIDDERRVMATGEALIGREEPALERTTGALRWLLTTKVPLRDEAGQIVGIVGISRNIGELRRIREELVQHRDGLQQLVEERTAELQVAKERAEAANEAKSRFLANMSHELRTPLNAVLGYAQILKRDDGLNERQAQGLNTIQHSGEHLLALIDDVLDLAKVEAGKFELCPEPLPLAEFMRVIDDIIRVKALDKNLQFSCETAGEVPAVVSVDDKRLRQVLLNLLSNAVKFTREGAVSLRLDVQRLENGTARLRFEVQDSGPGIAADQLETIFSPFEQSGAPQLRAGGTGLGLAISRQMTRLMGGELRVHSELGRGSRFWFEIEVPVLGDRAAAHRPQGSVTGYAGPRRQVLIADDMAENRGVLVELMQSLGFETTEVADGEALLAQAQARRPDLVITDIVMPVLDGLQATERLRRLPQLTGVPVLAVSANASGSDEHRSLAAGANAFLAKPIAVDRLLLRIGELLKLSWIEAPRVVAEPDPAPLVAPPNEELETLYRLAKIGNMRSIREQAERLVALDARWRPFADRLRSLAERFESRAILALIERYRLP
jgi:PAS domain S-box-containing protein